LLVNQSPFGQDAHSGAQPKTGCQVVRSQDHRALVPGSEFFDECERGEVKARIGLVQQQDGWIVKQRSSNRHALLLAA